MEIWRRLTMRAAFVVFTCFLVITIPVCAQSNGSLENGINPYGSYHGGNIDTVSMTNGNLFLHIPLLSYPQRGGKLTLDFFIRFNAKNWYTSFTCFASSGTCFGRWFRDDRYGMNGVEVAKDQTLYFKSDVVQVKMQTGGQTFTSDVSLRSAVSPDGSSHLVGQSSSVFSNIFPAVDGSGYTPLGFTHVIDRNGVRYKQIIFGNPPTGAGTETQDPNGNKITVSPSGWTDTLGRFIPGSLTGPGGFAFDLMPGIETTNLAGCKSGTVAARVWNVPAFNGSTATYKLCYGNIPFQTNFNVHTVKPNFAAEEASGTIRMLHQIVLPNVTSWNF